MSRSGSIWHFLRLRCIIQAYEIMVLSPFRAEGTRLDVILDKKKRLHLEPLFEHYNKVMIKRECFE